MVAQSLATTWYRESCEAMVARGELSSEELSVWRDSGLKVYDILGASEVSLPCLALKVCGVRPSGIDGELGGSAVHSSCKRKREESDENVANKQLTTSL